MEIDMTELRKTFFQDADDHLEAMELALGRLQQQLTDDESLGALFCSVHTLKGDSGAMGYESISTLLHQAETLLDGIRDAKTEMTDDTVDILHDVMDHVVGLIEAEKEDAPAPEGFEQILAVLEDYSKRHLGGGEDIELVDSPVQVAAEALEETEAAESDSALAEATDVVSGEGEDSAPCDAESASGPADFGLFEDEVEPAQSVDPMASLPPFFGDYLVERGMLRHDQIIAALDDQRSQQPLLGKVLIQSGRLTIKQAAKTLSYVESGSGRLGETAVQLGYLDTATLNDALDDQRASRPGLRQTIVQLGFLSEADVQSTFREFVELYPDAPNAESVVDEEEIESLSSEVSSSEPAGPTDLEADPELIAEFIGESREHLEIAEEQLLIIESDPGNVEALNAIYRAFHTIKGVSSFLGLEDTRNLAHQAESMLNLARDGKLELSGDAFEVALASIDGLKRQVGYADAWLAQQGSLEVDPQLPALLTAIDAVARGIALSSLANRDEPAEAKEPSKSSAPSPANTGGEREVAAQGNRTTTHVKESIKVDRDRLDKLINVIGELVIGQAMVEEEVAVWQAQVGHESLAMSQLNKTVRDLQELSLSLRMVPIGSVFHKMARIVRDLGRKLGKDIHFETEGDETELDKTVVDQIGDPLMHMVRNAADHGIEAPEVREAAGKPAQGRIVLRAFHQGGNIYIEIEDDGKGLDREALLKKAIERGIASESDTLSEQEIDNLIFAPGFSTAKQVTDVSGRGVGMDVVRRNVEALQGSVTVSSEKGSGSTVVIRLPLTLAILDGLSIRIGNDIYIIPILSVVESFSPQPGDIKRIAAKGEVVMVRGEVVPLLRLAQLMRLRPDQVDDDSQSLVVIVEDRNRKYALMVDELVGQSQVVIKNLEANYRKVDGIAGATILGDGRIAMILDVFGLVSLSSSGRALPPSHVAMDAGDDVASQTNELITI